MSLQEQIREWVEKGELFEELADLAFKLARRHLGNRPAGTARRLEDDEIRDIAGDFLLYHIRGGNRTQLRSQAAMAREMKRFITNRENPERVELWQVLSEAIHKLAAEGQVERLDATHEQTNSNGAIWALPGSMVKGPLDLGAFEKRAERIPTFYPQTEGGRVLPPNAAAKLLVALLEAAEGPIEFGLLFQEAQRHVVNGLLYAVQADPDPADDEVSGGIQLVDQAIDVIEWVGEEALLRADRAWGQISALQQDRILCLYTLPKHFLARKVPMSQLGTPQRIHEAHRDIMDILGSVLAVERLPSDGFQDDGSRFRKAYLALVEKVTRILMGKCSEKGLDACF